MSAQTTVDKLRTMEGLQASVKRDLAEVALCLERIANNAEVLGKLADELRTALP